MTALATFLATTKRIEALLSELPRIRDLPDAAARAVERVEIRPHDWDRSAPDLLSGAKAAREIQRAMVESRRAEGAAVRDVRLQEIAAEIRALVSVIPQQAAAASIELGHQARMLQHEANGGTL